MENIKLEHLTALVKSNRTYRRFRQDQPISEAQLRSYVSLCRYTASGRNAQPLKYVLITDVEKCAAIFPTLAWAGYYKDWAGPEAGERPVAYIIQVLDKTYGANCLCDDGLQLEAITLAATTEGVGSCIIKSFNKLALTQALNLPEYLEPRYVVAMGYPAEIVKIEDMDGTAECDFKYYRTADGVHHVPKRPLSELIV